MASGRKYISSTLAERLTYELDRDGRQAHARGAVRSGIPGHAHDLYGKSVKEIAEALGLSVKTVSTYRSRIMEKMNMKNNAEIVLYAVQNKLID